MWARTSPTSSRTISLTELLNECRDEVANSRRLLADDVFDQLVGKRGHARAVRVQDLVVDSGGERLDSGSGNGGDVFPDRIDKRLHIRHVGCLVRACWVCAGLLDLRNRNDDVADSDLRVDRNVHVEEVLALL
jgi:hypothetical protein